MALRLDLEVILNGAAILTVTPPSLGLHESCLGGLTVLFGLNASVEVNTFSIEIGTNSLSRICISTREFEV